MSYKNSVLAEKVKETFSSRDITTVNVQSTEKEKNVENAEIKQYLKDLENAYKKTSESSIKFG